MCDQIISMDDMLAIYYVTDRFGIDRERIAVPLEKEGTGTVTNHENGELTIVVPFTIGINGWLKILEQKLLQLGFNTPHDEDEWPS